MTRTFCTLFDRNYLYQGVALHASLERHAPDFRLYALCMDQTAFDLLTRLDKPTLLPILVDDVLTPALSAVRSRTTHGQFCWVCQPIICQYLLDRFGVDMVTYLESDSLFFSDPEALFAELGDRSVSLVPHNYSSEFDNSSAAGMYCVQFNAFRNDADARAVLQSWTASCFEYDRSAPTSYPGQTCLDRWPSQFAGVAVIQHPGAGVAPWNIRGLKLGSQNGVPTVNGLPVVFYHFHQYGRFRSGAHELGSYPMTRDVIDAFYQPYVQALRDAERLVKQVDPSFDYRRLYEDHGGLLQLLSAWSKPKADEYLLILKRKLRGRYNIYPDSYFSAGRRVSP